MNEYREPSLRALLAYAGDAALLCDANVLITYVSPAITRLLGWRPEELVGRQGLQFVHPEDQVAAHDVVLATLAAQGPQPPFELRLRTAAGDHVWIEAVVSNQLAEPDVGAVVMNLRDISRRKASEQALAMSEARFRAIVESAEEGIWVLDAEDRGAFANSRLEHLLAIAPGGLVGRPVTEFVHPDDRGQLVGEVASRRHGVSSRYECRLVASGGTVVHVLISGHPLFSADGEYMGTQGLVTDISALKEAQGRLENLAVRDELTGLPNRLLLGEALAAMLEAQRVSPSRVTVLHVDIDGLTAVNDGLGRKAGDEVLVTMATRLSQIVSPGDIVGRLGAGEFVVLCRDVPNPADAMRLAQHVHATATEPITTRGRELLVTVSVGVAQTPARSGDILLRNASAAAHQAGSRGVGRTALFSETMRRQTHRDLELMADLRRAIREEAGLELYFQPVIALDDLHVAGAEALIRWEHPRYGLLLPEQFVALAERAGVIAELDRWVLEAATGWVARWRHEDSVGDRFRVSVNVSGQHYSELSLARDVKLALTRSGIPAGCLVLEVTETAVVSDIAEATEVMRRLKALGVRIAIDDFGTGYSSLAYVRQFPVDTLKVDRSFVADLGDDPAADALVANILALADSVGIVCVAEGVETAEQLALLRAHGCEYGQGYLWSKAVPAAEFPLVIAALEHRSLPAPRRAVRAVTSASTTPVLGRGVGNAETSPIGLWAG